VKLRITYSIRHNSFWLGNPWFVESIYGFLGDIGHDNEKTNKRMKKWISKRK
jgi:hypothetical protein